MSEQITLDGEYVTRDGLPARVICVDRKGTLPPVIALVMEDGDELQKGYYPGGHYLASESRHRYDLVPKPKTHKRTVWFAWLTDCDDVLHFPSKAHADRYIEKYADDYLALTGPHEFEFSEGQGLPAGLGAEGEGKA